MIEGSGQEYRRKRDEIIARLLTTAQADQRIAALWLQGSLADGTEDDFSDIDAYVAVEDEYFDEVLSQRSQIVSSVAQILVEMDSQYLQAGHYLLEGLQKLDLFIERASVIEARHRPAAKVLHDRTGLTSRLRTGPTDQMSEARRGVEIALLGTLQGAAWPLRLVGRGQWATLALAWLTVVNDSVALLMAVQHDLGYASRNRFSLPRLLSLDQRSNLEALTNSVLAAIESRDASKILHAQVAILDALFAEGRKAYQSLAIDYPLDAEIEEAIRRSYREIWPS